MALADAVKGEETIHLKGVFEMQALVSSNYISRFLKG